ncbi:MAG: hypothetical protein K8T26_19930 [Lentisphaerae bacterium]|nr:hypothetical protein [Lentisphaerota bacterium]
MTRTLPDRGQPSPRYRHLGMWNYSLGPNSPIPGQRLQVYILDQAGEIIRCFEQIEGRCIDPGYVDFFESHHCRPALHEMPIVDIDYDGQIAAVLCPHFTQSMGMKIYLKLLGEWVNRWGKPEYAL